MNQLEELLENCGRNLGVLSSTCCQSQKGEDMTKLLKSFANVHEQLDYKSDISFPDQLITFVEENGALIGVLHVTCCTTEREKIYEELLRDLNKIFQLAWQLKDAEH